MIIRIYNRYINNVRKYINMLKADKYSWMRQGTNTFGMRGIYGIM